MVFPLSMNSFCSLIDIWPAVVGVVQSICPYAEIKEAKASFKFTFTVPAGSFFSRPFHDFLTNSSTFLKVCVSFLDVFLKCQ